ncbi:MAG TPA: hypothetical protein VNN72_23100 [Polyangiaceae bacterium]|nr:hypothetical protein [Polyangiaceae bacterium]
MRLRLIGVTFGALLALPLACKKDEQPPPQPPPAYQPYPAQPAAPAPAQPTAAQPVPAQPVPAQPGQPAPAAPAPAGGAMSQPSPMALACSNDAACLTHRCNTQFGKCAWPCQSDNDCVTGNHCMAGACVPKMQ